MFSAIPLEVEDACAKRPIVDLWDMRRVSKYERNKTLAEVLAAEERLGEWTSCVGLLARSQQVSPPATTKKASNFSLHYLNFLVPSTIH